MLKTNQLEGRVLATVLAALRYWQQDFDELDLIDGAGHFEDHKPLDADEIDELCEALNFPGETPAYTLFRHVTAGGAEYLTDNHMFADATLIIRLDGGAELVTCEGMKTETPEVKGDTALAEQLNRLKSEAWERGIEREFDEVMKMLQGLRGEPAKACHNCGKDRTEKSPRCERCCLECSPVSITEAPK
jgi:hypothetical protein